MSKNLLKTVLATTATKREAKQYIQKYGWNETTKQVSIVRISGRDNHLALNDRFGPNLARTLSYLKDLGSYPVIVLDGQPQIDSYLSPTRRSLRDYETQLFGMSEKLSMYLHQCGKEALTLNSPFELSARKGLEFNHVWLEQALEMQQVPILLPLMYDRDTNESKFLDSFKGCRQLASSLKAPYVTDKLIFVDPLGGLPSQRRKHAAHVLINLKQEYGEINAELRGSKDLSSEESAAHMVNLNAMHDILAVCGPQSTGLITDPYAAGNMLDRNPIVYNLLTDRPLISPSLPAELTRTQLRTSLLRTGFPVYVRHSSSPETGLDLYLEDKVGNINLTKLTHLIEKSFKRTLDVDHYLTRLKSAVAAIIVVGDYDGVAIITWEESPLTGRKIPYLDKFTVDPSSQGAQGVADIMLIQMIRRLFPKEVVWRSRYNNPVNKWYFERSRGHLRLRDSMWTMFWITDEVVPPVKEYESVCRNIEPSLK